MILVKIKDDCLPNEAFIEALKKEFVGVKFISYQNNILSFHVWGRGWGKKEDNYELICDFIFTGKLKISGICRTELSNKLFSRVLYAHEDNTIPQQAPYLYANQKVSLTQSKNEN